MPYKPGTNPSDPYALNQESAAEPGAWGSIAYNAAELAAGFVPGVGEAIDVKNAYESYQQGDYLGAGISAAAAGIGVIPVAGDLAATGLRVANKARGFGRLADAARGTTANRVALGKDVALSVAPATELAGQVSQELSTPSGFTAENPYEADGFDSTAWGGFSSSDDNDITGPGSSIDQATNQVTSVTTPDYVQQAFSRIQEPEPEPEFDSSAWGGYSTSDDNDEDNTGPGTTVQQAEAHVQSVTTPDYVQDAYDGGGDDGGDDGGGGK